MDRVYVLEGEDSFLIQEEIQKVIGKEDVEKISYDMKETSIESAIEDLDTLNFLTNKKVVVCYNCYFLTGEKPRNVVEQNIDLLMKYIEHPHPDNLLILVCSKLDERKAIVKKLKTKAKILSLSTNLISLMDRELEDYEISFTDKRYLMDRTLNNPERIMNEIDKLKLYKSEDKKITREDIDCLVPLTIDDDVFALVDAILKRNKKKAFQIYEDMLLHNEEPMKILILLANKIRLFYQVKILSKTIHRDEEIGKIIGSHPYPVKLAREMVFEFQEKELLHYLDQLAHIDRNVKMGKTYQNIAFETFLLRL